MKPKLKGKKKSDKRSQKKLMSYDMTDLIYEEQFCQAKKMKYRHRRNNLPSIFARMKC